MNSRISCRRPSRPTRRELAPWGLELLHRDPVGTPRESCTFVEVALPHVSFKDSHLHAGKGENPADGSYWFRVDKTQ
jgi:hypothetical protein